jgi:hypothetical protein
MFLQNATKSSPKLKKIVHWLLIPRGQARPKLWVRLFINPFFHKKGSSTIIRVNNWVSKNALIGVFGAPAKNMPASPVAMANPAQVINKYNFATGSRQKV